MPAVVTRPPAVLMLSPCSVHVVDDLLYILCLQVAAASSLVIKFSLARDAVVTILSSDGYIHIRSYLT